ncbi:MAG TPA: hypothetical protein DD379_10875 [Cyanobacteria bacterium UBA11162]|nr:hypothetical protein [Cyanobacteria bacterium UBA11162]
MSFCSTASALRWGAALLTRFISCIYQLFSILDSTLDCNSVLLSFLCPIYQRKLMVKLTRRKKLNLSESRLTKKLMRKFKTMLKQWRFCVKLALTKIFSPMPLISKILMVQLITI